MARRRLEDLYIIGKEVTIGDGRGDPVVVWIQKINQIEAQKCLKAGNAARAKVAAAKRDPDSDIYLAVWDVVLDMDTKEALASTLAIDQAVKRHDAIEAEVAADDEWAKDDYLDGLREAWEGGLSQAIKDDPENAEAKRVLAELTRFEEKVEERVGAEMESARAQFVDLSEEELRQKVFDRLYTLEMENAWVQAFRRQELFFSLRDPDDHDRYYFSDPDEIDMLSPQVINRLRDEVRLLNVEILEGKG